MEKFPHALGFESLDSFFQSQQARFMFHSRRGGYGGDKRLVQLELACAADGVASTNLAIASLMLD